MNHLAAQRLGFCGYCRMLACITKPADMLTIRNAIGAYPTTIHTAMAYCVRQRVAHVVGWHRPAPHSRAVATWLLGPGVSMPDPDGRPATRAKPSSALGQLVAILQALQEEPMTRAEIAEDIGYSIWTVERAVRCMREAGLLHVASWDQPIGPGTTVARFAFGPGIDRRRPRQPPRQREYQRRYAARARMAGLLNLRRQCT